MFQIGEFSKLVRVSPRMLRHYEKCGLVAPAETDRFTGYRRYSAAQVPQIMRIVALRDMGFSIEEIGDVLLHFDDTAYLDRVLNQKTAEIQALMETASERLRRVEQMRMRLKGDNNMSNYEVVLKELPQVTVLSYRTILANYSREGEMWQKLCTYMAERNISCPTTEVSGYSIYHDGDYKETDVDVEIAVPVDKTGDSEGDFQYRNLEAVPLTATLRFSGPYEGYMEAATNLAVWIEENGYEICGLMRGAAIRTEADQTDPNNFLTELQMPVKK